MHEDNNFQKLKLQQIVLILRRKIWQENQSYFSKRKRRESFAQKSRMCLRALCRPYIYNTKYTNSVQHAQSMQNTENISSAKWLDTFAVNGSVLFTVLMA